MRIAPIHPTARLADFGHKHPNGYVCHECGKPKAVTARYGLAPLIRCITPGCGQTTFKPIDREATSFASRNWI